jgi:two-component system sensor histidine kinase YcbA
MFIIHKFKKVSKVAGVTLLLTALLTAIASEVKVIPFNGGSFRFGLGSITFFLLILIWPPVSLIRTGIITGITVVVIRCTVDLVWTDISLLLSFKEHFPVLLFYFLFGLGFSIIKVGRYKMTPLLLGAWATAFEFIGNSVEELMRLVLQTSEQMSVRDITLLLVVALFRSYFIVGLYSAIIVSEQNKRMQEILKVGSELYADTLYLKKSMNEIEQITASSHDLYRKLKKKELRELSTQALNITQQIHEVKKDSQRILAGLSKITNRKDIEVFFLSDVLEFVVTGNEKYSEYLQRKISFQVSFTVDYETEKQIPLLALLNNLTANAVEAISENGEIVIELFEKLDWTCFIIKDNGVGVQKEDVSIIFEPGYTTKFNDKGVAATGIGLSHVKEIVQSLEGQIHMEMLDNGTLFRIEIPTKKIRK